MTGVVARADVVAWAAGQCGPRHAEARVVEGPAAFLVRLDPDAVYEGRAPVSYGGGTSVVVRKKTGDYWHLANDPESQFVHTAKNDRRLRRGLAGVVDVAHPAGSLRELRNDVVVAWVAATYGAAHARRRVGDGGFVYWVDTRSDAVIEGRAPVEFGTLSVVVLKRTGEYWFVGSNPHDMAIRDAAGERELRAGLGKPEGRVTLPKPPRGGGVSRADVEEWLGTADGQIYDYGWAFTAAAGPMLPGAMPYIVVKASGEVWLQSSSKPVPMGELADERAFHAHLAADYPGMRPHDRIVR